MKCRDRVGDPESEFLQRQAGWPHLRAARDGLCHVVLLLELARLDEGGAFIKPDPARSYDYRESVWMKVDDT
jgi:hypothetical protein